ncbi:sensor histidine kinase [Hymenobacter persicinus]|uniref:Sensor histidine kinase n=1 Tax=Hymenobacter persicinus TaxID=2025506 RepID=A0A4Q5L894_9BACT|nr:sensor histidine kinase [Hymenobacter persicinus]RYU77862.1 sensor histidine kinase [Hymenobacter persicinus]
MERIKNIFRLIHLVVWILFGLLVALQLSSEGDIHWLSTGAGFIATGLYVFYCHFYLLTHTAGPGKRRRYLLGLLAIVLTGPGPFLLLYHKPLDTFGQWRSYYCMHLISTAIFLGLSWLARVTENLVLNTLRKEQLEKQAAEAELTYLKAQINPHFLFNTLNNIHTLVYKQAPAAPAAVLQLASLMRYMIYESNAATVPLTRELDYLQDYVNLQQLRYKSSPVVDLRITGDPAAGYIAPLLFVHLLENAYKHSPARLAAGDLKVRVDLQGNVLTFSVQNPIGNKPATPLDEPGGIGLPNVRKRLALLYPGQHTLTIHPTAATFTATLTVHGVQPPPHATTPHLRHH